MTNRKSSDPASREARYDQLRRRLVQTSWISEGYVQDRGPGAGGPCYQWTRKVKGKTVSVALSELGFSGAVKVRDLWAKKDLGEFTGTWSRSIPAHGAELFRLRPVTK